MASASIRGMAVNAVCTPTASASAPSRRGRPPTRALIASLPNTPDHMLRYLATDPERVVREAVAAAAGTGADVLIALARDPSNNVRRAVLDSPRVPEAALRILVNDRIAALRSLAETRLRAAMSFGHGYRVH